MKRCLFLACLLFASKSFANFEEGCSISGLLTSSKSTAFKSLEDTNCKKEGSKDRTTKVIKIAITEELISVQVIHETRKILIEREVLDSKKEKCPPFCIEPMNIADVKTLGELEVLSFIEKLKEKKARLLIDVRSSKLYAKGSIPGAINLPFDMIEAKSPYQAEVLTLLGATAIPKNARVSWSFQEAQFLLIFGDSTVSNEASKTIKELLRLGYPSAKLLYYRGGVNAWKGLGLTLILKN